MTQGNAVAQAPTTPHLRIMGVAGQQTVDGRLNNGFGCIEVRVADRQQQYVDALFAQLQCAIVNLPGRGAFTGDALGQA
ncbi:hypothetical protein D3C76_741350 [compost metagenome]